MPRASFPVALLALAALLALSACDEPKPRGPGAGNTVVELGRLIRRTVLQRQVGTPPPPAWARTLIGKSPDQVFAGRAVCQGNLDQITRRYTAAPRGVRVLGWGWDPAAGVRVARVVLVDVSYHIVAAGDGGAPRPDVPLQVPTVSDPDSGWVVNLPQTHGKVDAYGLVGAGLTACPLGHLEF